MKRFMLFTYDTYYPAGGMNDFRGSFDDLEEALRHCAGLSQTFFHIFDLKKNSIAATNDASVTIKMENP